jgi:hypothetical protein
MQKWMVSAPTARGATGVKTAIGAITPPPFARRISAIWCTTMCGALLTTAESIGGIFEVESAGMEAQAFPLDQENMLTGGDAHLPAHIIPVNLAVTALSAITGYTTLDDTVTGGMLHRWGCCFES